MGVHLQVVVDTLPPHAIAPLTAAPAPHPTVAGLDIQFSRMLKASPYVTTDPNEADFFFLDILLYWCAPHYSK